MGSKAQVLEWSGMEKTAAFILLYIWQTISRAFTNPRTRTVADLNKCPAAGHLKLSSKFKILDLK